MNREETKKAIEIMQAYADDRGEIEACDNGRNNWRACLNPHWNFTSFTYRIKPQPSYRPYANMQEVLKDKKIHGDMVIRIDNEDSSYQLCWIGDEGVEPYNMGVFEYELALKEFTWEDGTPFGVKEE